MDKKTDSTYLRLPEKLKDLVRQNARKKGLTFNQTIIHLLARQLHIEDCLEHFHIEQYTENFFSESVRNSENNEQE